MNKFPNIPESTSLPKELGIWKWYFPENRIGETVTINGQEVKKLLTLDINIPDSRFAETVNESPMNEAPRVFARNYPCMHACSGCFNNATIRNPIMSLDEVLFVVDQAIELGLESVKFLGPGELLANPDLFFILDAFKKRNIVIGIFTKGAILGSDILSQMYHGIDSDELVKKITSYDNTTFLVGGRSFDPIIENKNIPTRDPELRGSFNYHEARNLALERLCAAGINNDPERQRLSIQTNPVTTETIDGVLEIFQWATKRNISTCVTTTMVSGKGHKLIKGQQELAFEERYTRLAVDIYSYLIEQSQTTLAKIQRDGVSSYLGVAPCNQLTHGLYVHYDGEVWRCPGNDTPDFVVYKDIRKSTLLNIWKNSSNYKINEFNNGCVKDGVSIPQGFYERVLRRLKEKY